VRLKREHTLRKRAIRDYQGQIPYWVNWFVFESRTTHPIYDEPGERTYKGPYRVPILWVFDEEGSDRLGTAGRRVVRMATFAVSVQALRNHGVPLDPDDRQLDMVEWDGFRWDVQSVIYTSLSDMQSDAGNRIYGDSDELTARVRAIRRHDDYDATHDAFPG